MISSTISWGNSIAMSKGGIDKRRDVEGYTTQSGCRTVTLSGLYMVIVRSRV